MTGICLVKSEDGAGTVQAEWVTAPAGALTTFYFKHYVIENVRRIVGVIVTANVISIVINTAKFRKNFTGGYGPGSPTFQFHVVC